MRISDKIAYFLMGVLFTGMLAWNITRPVEAVAPTSVERKVHVLSDREMDRIHHDIAGLEKSIQEDNNFLKFGPQSATGKVGASGQYAQKKKMIEENLPGKENRIEELRAQLQTLQM